MPVEEEDDEAAVVAAAVDDEDEVVGTAATAAATVVGIAAWAASIWGAADELVLVEVDEEDTFVEVARVVGV